MVKSSDQWEKLSPYNQVRRRAEMYFGSRDLHTQVVPVYTGTGSALEETTWVPAVYCCIREIIDNCLDEVVTHRRGSRIDVTYDPSDRTFCIADDGAGMPIDWSDQHQGYAPTILLSSMFSGRNFIEERGETRGLNGIGAKGVNFCSEWFQVEIHRSKKQFIQSFAEGDELQIGEPFIWPINRKKTGTTIRFRLSPQVFPHLLLPEPFIRARLREVALCFPQLKISFNGTPMMGNIRFDNRIEFTVVAEGFNGKFWLVPDFVADGEFVYSLVNGIPLFNGGTHVDAFRRYFYTGLLDCLERESNRRKLTPNRADISDGLLIFAVVEMANPSFDSQAKTRLINEHVAHLIRQTLAAPEFYKDIIRKHPGWIETIYQRCAKRSQTRDTKAAIRDGKRNLRQKIEALEDACSHDRSKCTLFITEGKSASSGISSARNAEIHGTIPLTGKILNAFDVTAKKVLENEALSKLMAAIGLAPGQRANRHTLRYGSVALACDADEDGRNIACLLLNFFFRFWPDLFHSDYFYVLETPLIIAVKQRQRRYWYNDELSKFDPERIKGWDVTRAKGLAALTQDDWRKILEQPRLRPIKDDGALQDALRLVFSQEAGSSDRRKSWIGM